MRESEPMAEPSWDEIAATWQQESAPVPDVRAAVRGRARANTIRLWLIVAGELLLTLAVVALTSWMLAAEPDAITVLWLVWVWLAWAVAARFAFRNRRGVWQAAGEATLDYLRLGEERARRKLNTARFTIRLVIAQTPLLALLVGWRLGDGAASIGDLAPRILLFALVCLVYLVWATWFRRRAEAELSGYRQLGDELALNGDRHDDTQADEL